jgi:hypothetical protein
VVFGIQVRCEQTQSSHVHAPAADRLQDRRQAPSGAGEGDPAVGSILGKPIFADAKGEHRVEGLGEEELSRVDLTKMEKELRLHAS